MTHQNIDEEAEAPRIVPLGRFYPELDLEPMVEVVLDCIANTIHALAGGRYTEKDRVYPLWAFHLLDEAGYALDPGDALVWLRRDGRIRIGAERVAELVGETPSSKGRRNPYKRNIIEIWRTVAARSLAHARTTN